MPVSAWPCSLRPEQPCPRKSTYNSEGFTSWQQMVSEELCSFSSHLLSHPVVWASEGEGALQRYRLGPPGFLGIFLCVQAPRCTVCCRKCRSVQRGCGISNLGDTQSSAGQGSGQPNITLKLDLTSKVSLFGAGGCTRGWTSPYPSKLLCYPSHNLIKLNLKLSLVVSSLSAPAGRAVSNCFCW